MNKIKNNTKQFTKEEIKEIMDPYFKKLDIRKDIWNKDAETHTSYHDFILENYYQ